MKKVKGLKVFIAKKDMYAAHANLYYAWAKLHDYISHASKLDKELKQELMEIMEEIKEIRKKSGFIADRLISLYNKINKEQRT